MNGGLEDQRGVEADRSGDVIQVGVAEQAPTNLSQTSYGRVSKQPDCLGISCLTGTRCSRWGGA